MTDIQEDKARLNQQRYSGFRARVLADSKAAFESFLDYLPEKLLDYAQQPGAVHDIIGALHVKQRLSEQRIQTLLVFSKAIEEAFDAFLPSFGDTSRHPNSWREDNISLVSFDDMEEEAALTSISHRSETTNSKLLWGLRQRFSMLVGGNLLPEKGLPFSPLIYCQGMRQVVQTLDIPVRAKLVVYTLFEKKFLAQVGELYKGFNSYLVDQGVLPNLNYAIHNKQSANWRTRYKTISSELMKELLVREEDVAGLAGASHDVQYTVSQLVQATRQLQQYAAQKMQQDVPTSDIRPADIAEARNQLVAHLQTVVGSDDKPNLTSDDMKTIELVGMLFEYMLNDEQLPDVVKALLSHLHTAFIKVALANKDFFDHEQHPARLLLNSLADAGVKWVGNDGKSQYGVLETIRATVTEVLDELENDPKLFARLLMDFSSYVKKVQIKVQMLEKRAAEKARGEDRLNQVKRQVNREIKSRIGETQLPSAILLLLLQPWSDYLAFLLLRYGDKSDHWQQAVNLIDDLLWGLELENTVENRLLWRQNYPWVESIILKGFETIGYDPGKAAKLKRAIDKVYEFSYQSERTATPEELRKKMIRLADEKAGKVVDVSRMEKNEARVVDELTQLQFGTWFEYRDGRREKLAWFNRESLQFLFVDQAGKRTAMRDGLSLAQQVNSGELQIITLDEQPLVERTLESIYTDLAGKRGATLG